MKASLALFTMVLLLLLKPADAFLEKLIEQLLLLLGIFCSLFGIYCPASCEPSPCVHGSCEEKRREYTCLCDQGWEGKNCDANPAVEAFREALEETNLGILIEEIPSEVIQQIVEDAPIVPGSVTFTSNAQEFNSTFFEVEESSASDSFTVEGYFTTDIASGLPADVIARLYFQDGLHSSTSVDPFTGQFAVVATGIPYGVNPFIIVFVSESNTDVGDEGQRSLLTSQNPMICMAKNVRECGPVFALTLTWDTPTADIDLHVFEPGGKHVYFDSKLGDNGAFLDYDDTEGFGPEHYVVPSTSTVFTDIGYMLRVDMFDYDKDTDVDVNWILEAHSFGSPLWNVTGRFRFGQTASKSDYIPWIFDEQPVCKQSCSIDVQRERMLLLPGEEFCMVSLIPSKYPWWCNIWRCNEDNVTPAWKFYQQAKTLTTRKQVKGIVAAIYTPAVIGMRSASATEKFESALALTDTKDPSCILDIAMEFFCTQCWWKSTRTAMDILFHFAAHESSLTALAKVGNKASAVMEVLANEAQFQFFIGYGNVLDFWKGAFTAAQISRLQYEFEAFC